MCAIAGIIRLRGRSEVTQADLAPMLAIQKHRGPDGFGTYLDEGVALGHARLSIIDLEAGRQPMCNEDGSVWITFNGEIFNYIEIREALEKKGHKFSTHSDTEVIIHLYEDYGSGCVDHLNGQFAFAIWDTRKQELYAARDRMGIRPFFYAVSKGLLYFASEVKAIFATGEIDRAIDLDSLNEIFTFWHTVAPSTAFKGVNELPPAHFLKVKNGELTTGSYWEMDFPESPVNMTFDDAKDELRRLLIDSTRLQLRADVPVGAYLSGGLDSSSTAALVRNFSASPLQTFSVAFEDGAYDESSYQMQMAKALGTEHHFIRCTYSDISACFPDVIWHAEKPVLRTAPAPLYLLSSLVRRSGFKVVLTGEGADEVLGGYDIFKETKIRQFWAKQPDSNIRPMLLKKLYPYLPAFQGQSKAYREAFFNTGLSDPSDLFFSHRPRWQTTSKNSCFFSEEARAAMARNTEGALRSSIPAWVCARHPLARAQYIEATGLLPGYILSSQGDRMAMANSIEGRFPFLDHRVVEFASSLPYHFKIRGLNEKYVLKECMKDLLPKTIVKRTKQPYLAPDSKSFFRSGRADEYVETLFSERSLKDAGFFNPRLVKLLVDKCRRAAAIGFRDNMAFMGILSTQIVYDRFINNFPVQNRDSAFEALGAAAVNAKGDRNA